MKLPKRTSENLNNLINQFLKKHQLFDKNALWEVRESKLGGFGVFAKRDIRAGEVVFIDYHVIFGPRCVPNCPILCVSCCQKTNLKDCGSCGAPICSSKCQNSKLHRKECEQIRRLKKTDIVDGYSEKIFHNMAPLRALFLSAEDQQIVKSLLAHRGSQHGHEIDVLKSDLNFEFSNEQEEFLRFVCAVLDANAFEVTVGVEENQSSLRGLYPLASLANHSCFPNTAHVFDDKQRMVVKASVFLPKDSEIFHSYTRIMWGSLTRIYHLQRTKHFICRCERCEDPTEFGTYMCAVLCKKCRGNVIPTNPYKPQGRWICEDCRNFVNGKEPGEVISVLGSVLRGFTDKDFPIMYKFLKGKLGKLVPETNQVAVEIKYKIVWILGHKPGYYWKDLSMELLKIKEDYCLDILKLLEKLKMGQCNIRGLLLYELFCCKREINSRNITESKKEEVPDRKLLNYLEEASSILMYDVTAPKEIKEKWSALA